MQVRILAVHMVRVRKKSIGEAVAGLMWSEKRTRNWRRRYDRGGLDNLRNQQ